VIVEIRGTNTRNKGAQLMLQAICSRLGAQSDLAVLPATTDRAVRRRFGLQQTLSHPVLPRVTSSLGNAVPAGIRADYGLISDREIDGVLDASGFHYTDQLPTAFARSEARAGRAWARRGVPKIVMPQAFGPFEKQGTRRWTREALEQASLVFVRDRVSESYIRQLRISTTIVRSPDFTIGIKPPSIDAVSGQPFLALVPNTKLFTHGGIVRSRYVDLLVGFGGAAKANGLASVVVVHEATDHDVARELADRIGAPLFSNADPLVLKAALGRPRRRWRVASTRSSVACRSPCRPWRSAGRTSTANFLTISVSPSGWSPRKATRMRRSETCSPTARAVRGRKTASRSSLKESS
jgi:hypothetical protein